MVASTDYRHWPPRWWPIRWPSSLCSTQRLQSQPKLQLRPFRSYSRQAPIRSNSASLNRPGGNVTGVSFLVTTLAAKRLELLRATVVGLLVNPGNPTSETQIKDAQTAALSLGLRLTVQGASSDAEINAAFASFARQRVNAMIISADAFFGTRHDLLVGLAARYAIPDI